MSFWDGKRVLVTGGAGMIGSHLAEALIGQGAHVEVLDDFSRGPAENLQGRDAQGTKIWHARLGSHYGKATRRTAFTDQDVIFHLAARVTGIQFNMSDDFTMLQDNLAINHDTTQLVQQHHNGRYIYVSTACIYPHDAPVPTKEKWGEVGDPEPTNRGYGIAKWVGEQQAKGLHSRGVKTAIVRFFNAFGPRDYYDEATSHVVPALIRRFIEARDEGRESAVIWGSGEQTRVFVDSRDIARALLHIGEKACDGRPTNIGHSREVSIRHLAYHIRDLVGYRGQLIFDRGRPDGYRRRAADTIRLEDITGGWVPDTPLAVTLNDMVVDYKARYPDGFEGLPQGRVWEPEFMKDMESRGIPSGAWWSYRIGWPDNVQKVSVVRPCGGFAD